MRWFFLGDAATGVGFALAGLDTRAVEGPAEVVRALSDLEGADPPYGVALITPEAAALAPNAVSRLAQRTEAPLLVVLPERARPAPRGGR